MKIKKVASISGIMLGIMLLTTAFTFAQETKSTETFSVQELVKDRAISLSSTLKSSVSGASRITIPITLPENTVAWYYAFSTRRGLSNNNSIQLSKQISKHLQGVHSIPEDLKKQIEVPYGTAIIDAFLLYPHSKLAFEDNWGVITGGGYQYKGEASLPNSQNGLMEITDITSGDWLIGIANPSTLENVSVLLEVVAVVKEGQIKNVDLSENKEITETPEKIEKTDSPPDETTNSKSNRIEIEAAVKEAKAIAAMGNYEEAKEKMISALQNIEENNLLKQSFGNAKLADFYNSAAWYALLTNDLENAEQLLKKGLIADASNMYLRGNLGNYHLLAENFQEAERAFFYYPRNAQMPNGKKWAEVIGEDLSLLESRGMANFYFAEIRKKLRIK